MMTQPMIATPRSAAGFCAPSNPVMEAMIATRAIARVKAIRSSGTMT